MLRIAFLIGLALAIPGQAMASAECDTASARWLELVSPGLEEKMGEPFTVTMADPAKRWRFIANSYIGSALAFSPDRSNAEQAETIVVLDTLVGCFQDEVPEGDRIDDLYPAEKRQGIRDAAEKIMKDGN